MYYSQHSERSVWDIDLGESSATARSERATKQEGRPAENHRVALKQAGCESYTCYFTSATHSSMALMLQSHFEPGLPDRFHDPCSGDSLILRDNRRPRQDGSSDDDTIKEFGNVLRF